MKEVYYMSKDQNTVYVGSKPAMSYVLAVITSYDLSDTKNVTLKARGRSMKTAVDVAEIVKRRFMKDLKAKKITIGTEELPQQEGGTRNVSTMEIMLTRD
jgi:DNA-binding protein